MPSAAHSKEFPLPVLVRVLEEGKEDSTRDPGKAYPEAFPLLFHLKEMQENVYGWEDAQVSTKNLKTPYKRPAVGVELGGGGIDFSKEFSLEGGKWETDPHAFEHCLVHKEEGFPLSRSVIQTDRFPRAVRSYHVSKDQSPKGNARVSTGLAARWATWRAIKGIPKRCYYHHFRGCPISQ